MNILLIEDDDGLVELITANLEELGFFVMSAASGALALAHLNRQTPDLMLLDYSLPDINGKEFIELLSKQQIPLPPFIITTGQGDERIAVDMMKLGALDYLIKDILFLEKLPEVIKRVIKEIESDAKLKQAEEKAKKSEEKLNLIINTSPIGICTVDSFGNFSTTNPAYERMVGYSKEECRSLSFFDVTHPNDRPRNKKLFHSMFSLEKTGFSMEKRYIRKDGSEINVEVHAVGILDADSLCENRKFF